MLATVGLLLETPSVEASASLPPPRAVRAAVAAGWSVGRPTPSTYRPPVDGPVVDPFRPPPEPWMAGNRGIEYATLPGSPVRAIGPGVVAFAGPVAGRLVVTLRHPDGLRSSYSGLATVEVRSGGRVAAGEAVGHAADRLHLGVRRGDTYLDPASLWGRRVGGGRVVLVPDRPPSPSGPTPGPGPSPGPGSVAAGRAAELAARAAHLGLTWG